MEKTTKELIQASLLTAMSYTSYRTLVTQLAKEGKSTGPEQTEALTNYTQLNDRRMKRWDKTLKFNDEILEKIAAVKMKTTWVVITESWCGDASPALPVMHKIAELNPNISLQVILRDENIDVMNQFLTNGGMSIPKLIVVDNETGEATNSWGPRSTNATQLVDEYKSEHGQLTAEFKQNLQVWYNKDKGQSVLEDLLVLFG